MNTLTLRIYLTVVAVLLLFAFGSAWLFQSQIDQERQRADTVLTERMEAWGELIQRSLPEAEAPREDQAMALQEWSQRLRLPLALDDKQGGRIAVSASFARRQEMDGNVLGFPVRLADGRTLWVMRPSLRPPRQGLRRDGLLSSMEQPWLPPAWRGVGLVAVLAMLFVAVAAGAWPAVRHLTRRLKALKRGVEQFGSGQLAHRVEVSGHDEVAAVAASFNQAAERIEALVRSHQSLLANASHELRSPLARMKMAVSMLEGASAERQARLKQEIFTNVGELDALVEEVLLASRLDAVQRVDRHEPVDLLALAAEEGARVDAAVDGAGVSVKGDERLLRRALRNLLENARRYGGGEVAVQVGMTAGFASLQVCDRGTGVPLDLRERIFEPFYRLPGHAEQAGGVGLGLSLVKQIAERHGGSVRCMARDGGGSCFELMLPMA
ncbi:MAG TPA: HAMP domain-containing sensor histidine kinase [Rhizobacter sp.]|nr:HAMP domain-containing sensor histidine kinase [Rhizobacter sp.]